MNRVVLMGRLTRDPNVSYTQAEQPMCIARYTLAVDRRNKDTDGNRQADFISCVAFGKSGEFVEKYLHKGIKVCISGRIQTGSYTNKDGVKVYTTDVVVEEHEFCESKGANDVAQNMAPAQLSPGLQSATDGFMQIPDGIDEELPFC
jgi:single-strand DNA-binding protein